MNTPPSATQESGDLNRQGFRARPLALQLRVEPSKPKEERSKQSNAHAATLSFTFVGRDLIIYFNF
jgi:hypothetical protein